MSESFADLLKESQDSIEMAAGTIITGVIVHMDEDRITVHAGLKSEGIIPRSQFQHQDEAELVVGDPVKVVLEVVDNGYGETIMSREKARRAEVWEKLLEAFNNNLNVTGVISTKVKGGYAVDISGIRAFLPGSLADMRPMRDKEMSNLEGLELDFRIIKIDQKRNNVVVSRRAVLEAENEAELQSLLDSLHEGQELTGIVKNLTEYGAFVDLGGIDGLLHVADMAWHRVRHPSELVELGQEIKVQVLRFDPECNRISLGLKQLGNDPWANISERYPVNGKFKATITNITDYGCFAELEEGVEGLVHVSEMTWVGKNIHPSKLVSIGDEVEVMVLALEENRRRISLGIKRCQPSPWELFAEQHEKGERIKTSIRSITDFGIFVALDNDIDGLVHLSDISWDEPGEQAVKNYKKGDKIEVVLLAVDPERERINLGVKQLEQDDFSDYLDGKSKGTVVKGTVVKREAQRIAVSLAKGVEAIMNASEVDSKKVVDDLRTHFSDGEEIEAAILGIDRKRRTIKLSIKLKQITEEEQALSSYRESVQEEQPAVGTIGDLIQEKMVAQRAIADQKVEDTPEAEGAEATGAEATKETASGKSAEK